MRVWASTSPRQLPSHRQWRVVRGVAFSNYRSQRWIKIFNPSLRFSDCVHNTVRGIPNRSTGFTLGGKWFERRRLSSSRKTPSSVRPRGTRPAPSVDVRLSRGTLSVSREYNPPASAEGQNRRPRESPCPAPNGRAGAQTLSKGGEGRTGQGRVVYTLSRRMLRGLPLRRFTPARGSLRAARSATRSRQTPACARGGCRAS